MTPKKAIRLIRALPTMCEFTDAYGTPIDSDAYYDAVDMAISALEKQIPKKVRITTSTKRCATCGRQLSGIGNIHPERNYCQRCGQAIDWGE